jgi:uncharacterized membrane protein YfbV (UPF0208 family)
MKVVLALDFFSKALLIVLLNMNFVDFGVAWLNIGEFTDFSVEWYRKVGYSIYFIMFFSIWTPLMETAMEWFVKFFQRMKDTNQTLDYFKT